jgi:hypothetical protein
MLIDQLSVFVANRHGRLSEITEILAEANIDIRALSLADTTDFGILRLIVNNPSYAEERLKANGLTVRLTKVIAAKLDDVPGALSKVLRVLTKADISVEYAYAFITPKNADACVILRVEDNEKAIDVLTENGVKLSSPSEIYEI